MAWDPHGPSWDGEACPRAAALGMEAVMFGRGRGGVASAGGKDVKRSQFEKGSSQFASVNPWEPAELWERHAANQKLTVLGQGGVDGPWSLSDTDRTGKIGPGRGVSWKKLSRPGEGAVGPVRMEKLLQAREECRGVLVSRRVATVFGPDQVQAPSHVGEREAPLLVFPAWR